MGFCLFEDEERGRRVPSGKDEKKGMYAMKKLFAMLLALAMMVSLFACSNNNPGGDNSQAPSQGTEESAAPSEAGEENTTPVDVTDPNAIDDNPTTADGKYEIAMITDVGDLKDKSFNEGTWNGVKLYAAANNKTYKYYRPANGNEATDDDRYDAYINAINAGAKVIVAPGFLQAGAMRKAAVEHPEVNFVFIDGFPLTERDSQDDPGEVLANVAGIAFQEEQCGYLAGYAVVKEGFTKLGFSGGGGGTNPACCRYGYGYVQGANAAAAEMGVNVEVRYTWQYGSNYAASPELQAMMQGWYTSGTQIVFAAGGSIFQSITAAAAANDGYVVGVDVDQSGDSDTVVTSAMKGLEQSVSFGLDKHFGGQWADVGGTGTSLGANEDAVGLPTATWSMENFSVEEYETLLAGIKDGSVSVDADYESGLEQAYSNLTLTIE